MKPMTIIVFAVGALLIWAGLKDRNPLEEVKSVLTTGKLTK